MDKLESFFRDIYRNFNDRNIEFVIAHMTNDVTWANGMDGGYVYGHDGLRNYWTRQFGMITSQVTPLQFRGENGVVRISVHQVVYDLNGNLLVDEMVDHFFQLKEGKIARFDIGAK